MRTRCELVDELLERWAALDARRAAPAGAAAAQPITAVGAAERRRRRGTARRSWNGWCTSRRCPRRERSPRRERASTAPARSAPTAGKQRRCARASAWPASRGDRRGRRSAAGRRLSPAGARSGASAAPACRTAARGEYLEAAYARAARHAASRRVAAGARPAASCSATRFPRWCAGCAPYIVWATLSFALRCSPATGWCTRYPDLIALFASPDLIATVERGQLWTEGMLNIVPSSVLSLQILDQQHRGEPVRLLRRVPVRPGHSLHPRANGLMLGAVFAFTGQHGLRGAAVQLHRGARLRRAVGDVPVGRGRAPRSARR